MESYILGSKRRPGELFATDQKYCRSWIQVAEESTTSILGRVWPSDGYEVRGLLPLLCLLLLTTMGLESINSRGAAFESDNWTWQLRMMDSMLTALEQALIGFAYVFSSLIIDGSTHYVFRLKFVELQP